MVRSMTDSGFSPQVIFSYSKLWYVPKPLCLNLTSGAYLTVWKHSTAPSHGFFPSQQMTVTRVQCHRANTWCSRAQWWSQYTSSKCLIGIQVERCLFNLEGLEMFHYQVVLLPIAHELMIFTCWCVCVVLYQHDLGFSLKFEFHTITTNNP